MRLEILFIHSSIFSAEASGHQSFSSFFFLSPSRPDAPLANPAVIIIFFFPDGKWSSATADLAVQCLLFLFFYAAVWHFNCELFWSAKATCWQRLELTRSTADVEKKKKTESALVNKNGWMADDVASVSDRAERRNSGREAEVTAETGGDGEQRGRVEQKWEWESSSAQRLCLFAFIRLFSPQMERFAPMLPKRRTDYSKVHLHVPWMIHVSFFFFH